MQPTTICVWLFCISSSESWHPHTHLAGKNAISSCCVLHIGPGEAPLEAARAERNKAAVWCRDEAS